MKKERMNMMKKGMILIILIALISVQLASATVTDTPLLYGIKGYPGDMITVDITLTGTHQERTGHWETYYKHIEGDNEKMDITSWITVNPTNYTLKNNESETFTVTIRIPDNAELGLYGVVSPDASAVGYGHLRRTYLKFTDADASAVKGGGVVVWAGFRIPVSVEVLGKPNPLAQIINGIKANITVIILLAGIIILLLMVLLLRRKGGKEQGRG